MVNFFLRLKKNYEHVFISRYESRTTLIAKVVLKTPKSCYITLVDTSNPHQDQSVLGILKGQTNAASAKPTQ